MKNFIITVCVFFVITSFAFAGKPAATGCNGGQCAICPEIDNCILNLFKEKLQIKDAVKQNKVEKSCKVQRVERSKKCGRRGIFRFVNRIQARKVFRCHR